MSSADQGTTGTDLHDLLAQMPRRAPRATYRLQLHPGFRFADAARAVAYLADLGVSEVYASPILTPRAGSTHGYDITDHGHLSPDLGGEDGFALLREALAEGGLGLLLDVVPNHMGVGDARNAWWTDVLENGPSSIYAGYFDIDWNPVPAQLRGKVLLPILGDQYGEVLERGELQLRYTEGAFWLAYWEQRLPINPRSYSDLLTYRLERLIADHGADHEDVMELQSIITAVKYLPPRTETDPARIAERNREKEVVKRRLDRLERASEPVRQAIADTLAAYNGRPGSPPSFDMLDGLLEQQPYRLAFWRVATEEINYRRFFDINDLAAIRVELPQVLADTHQLIFRLLAEGTASGLRIDHPDGLWDPPAYFRQLQERYVAAWAELRLPAADAEAQAERAAAIARWVQAQGPNWPLYVVAEKILSEGEPLPDDWAVAGTTGYDFLNQVNGVFVDQSARRSFDRLYVDLAEAQPKYANLVNSKKKEIMLVSLASEINALSHILDSLTELSRRYRDFTLNSLTFAIREVLACLPVYRTYISGPSITERDTAYIAAAVREAKARNPRTAGAIFDFIWATLTLRNLEDFAEDDREAVLRFVMKFQQISGPVMAKGVEDTSFYVFNRLVSLNEVGGHPEHFGVSPEQLHRQAAERARRWPQAMLAGSTHDTKRSEDVRARINVLSELPREWRQLVSRWGRLNAAKKTAGAGGPMPSRNDEYLLYQTLVGTWPDDAGEASVPASFKERIAAYMEKATREAKVHTSWINPNPEYDAAMRGFVAAILDGRRSRSFLESIAAFSRRVAVFGRFNALSQTLIRLCAPGVPDIYQGGELWDLSLVDPDNRRPVDYALRSGMLSQLRTQAAADRAALAAELLAGAADGRIKLYLIERALQLRRERPALFAAGGYAPLAAVGERAEHVLAFARRHGGAELICVAPRLSLRLAGDAPGPPTGAVWGDTWLPLAGAAAGDRYANIFTGEGLAAADGPGGAGLWLRDALAIFPLAMLVRTELP